MTDSGDSAREGKSRGFKVTDRRSLSSEGELKQPAAESESGTGTGTRAGATARPRAESPGPTTPIDFSSFVLSLATSAMMSLGEEGPQGMPREAANLPLAAQTIDVIAMLGQKTAGNLDSREQALLDSVLYDLRLRYAAVAKAK